ncbi:MAG TPA: O-antigen ligase family protein [Polyangiaceae bacterium]|jgi:O-antigen ligase|nr:O-antigen ligase family protein [Polyangiaceae bacterium]
MYALPGVLGLVIFILARPTDFFDALRGLPLLYIFFALALVGFVLDVRLGVTKLRPAPQLLWVLAFVIWCVATATVQAPGSVLTGVVQLAILLAIYVVIAQGLPTFKAFELVCASVLACSLFISAICVHQGLQPTTCVAVDQKDDQSAMGRPDGRVCESIETCLQDPPEPQALYRCEHAGIFGVTSIAGGRVRYVGVLHDPNEVALAVAVSVPLAIAFYLRRKTRGRLIVAGISAVLAVAAIIMSQSRGGILVFLGAVGVYFLRRYRWKGLLVGAVFALPVLLLGGRTGQTASESTTERVECWYEGLQMFRAHPLVGVGYGQFTEHHHLTAHNSLILAFAENGVLGAITWTAAIYLSIKIPLDVLRTVRDPEGEVARTWAMALLASLSGMLIGTMFLSFNYHFVLWIYLGLAGALWTAVRRHVPGWKIDLGWRDAGILAAANTVLMAGIYIYTRVTLG